MSFDNASVQLLANKLKATKVRYVLSSRETDVSQRLPLQTVTMLNLEHNKIGDAGA